MHANFSPVLVQAILIPAAKLKEADKFKPLLFSHYYSHAEYSKQF